MNVEQFVATTLQQVINGVATAQVSANASGAVVNPPVLARVEGGQVLYTEHGGQYMPHVIPCDFDIAIVVLEQTSELQVASLTLSSESKTSESRNVFSRVRFTVPVRLPQVRGR